MPGVSMRKGVQIGYGQRILSPKDIAGLAAWYDVSDGASLLKSNGSQVTAVGDTVALITDKSGNSGTNCLCLNGVAGNYASAPDSAAVSIAGDIDIRVNVAMDDWTPASNSSVFTKWDGAVGQSSWNLAVLTSGLLRFQWTTDGSTTISVSSSVAPTVNDRASLWIRVTLDVDNGAGGYVVTFYTSSDGTSWSQLGTATTGGSTTSIFDGTIQLAIGATGTGGSLTAGRIYRAQIYNGIAGTLVFDANFALASKLTTSFTESSSNAATVTINSSGATGARISGERDLVNLTAASQPTYLPWGGTNYGYLPGLSGAYYSTPDSAAVSITGDIDIRAYVALPDWSGTTGRAIMAKRDSSGTQYSWQFTKSVNAYQLQFFFTLDGSTQQAAATSSSLSGIVADNGAIWIRVTRVSASGLVSYYYSLDGVSWTALGTAVTTSGSIFDSTSGLEIGSNRSGTQGLMNGYVYRAQIYNGISGTLAFDFNPATYTSGTTFLDSSSNAATITLNGGATIVTKTCLYFDGSNDYMKAAAFSLSQPETVYFTGQQVSFTNGDAFCDGSSLNTMRFYQVNPSPTVYQNAGIAANSITSLGIAITAVLIGIFNGASCILRLNRGSLTGPANAGSSAANGFTLGASADATSTSNITASEILIYSTAQDLTLQNIILTYLGAKWRILLN